MELEGFFLGFLQPVAWGMVAVLAVLLLIGLGTPRRHVAAANRKTAR
jgi:uncharacterized membrane protein YfcA